MFHFFNDLIENWQLTLTCVAAACTLWFGVDAIGKRVPTLYQLMWWHWAIWFAVALGISFVGLHTENDVLFYIFFFPAVPAFLLAVFVPFCAPEPESRHQIAIYLALVLIISLISV